MSLPTPYDFKTVIASTGDTFDMLALDHYDEEKLTSLIIQYNPEHIDTIIFEEPTEIVIPLITPESASVHPDWRK